jgi:hypothetical protein
MKQLFIVCSLFFSIASYAQTTCAYNLGAATAAIAPGKEESVEMMEVKIKNNYQVQFIKQDKKNYLKIIIKDDLGFGKKGSLLLQSVKKQIYIKSTTLNIIDKTSAYFIIDLNNTYYLDNIKDFGLVKIIFNETVEFSIPKNDTEQIKKAAECFFNIVKDNIWPQVKKL